MDAAIAPIVLARPKVSHLMHVPSESSDYGEWAAFFVRTKLSNGKGFALEPCERPPMPDELAEPIASRGTPEQRAAFVALAQKRNVCILGPGGTGKSQMIHWVRRAFL